MLRKYHIDNDLIESFRKVTSLPFVIKEKNSKNTFNVVEIGLDSDFFDDRDAKNLFMLKMENIKNSSSMRFVPPIVLLNSFEGLSDIQVDLLSQMQSHINMMNKQWADEDQEIRLQEQLQRQEKFQQEIDEYNARKKAEQELLQHEAERRERLVTLVNRWGTEKQKENVQKNLLKPYKVESLITFFEEKERKYNEMQDKKENALKLEKIDLIDEDNKKVTPLQWLTLYKKALNGEERELWESRAVVANSILYCNAARALIANNIGSIGKETGERKGKEGNRLYTAAKNDTHYQGVFARLASAEEIDDWVTSLYNEEWTNIKEL